jgi:hypothetical protein
MPDPTWFDDDIGIEGGVCVCGQPATVPVQVAWMDGPATYWYCEDHASEIVDWVGGCEVDFDA